MEELLYMYQNSNLKHLQHEKTAIQNDDERVINILIQLLI